LLRFLRFGTFLPSCVSERAMAIARCGFTVLPCRLAALQVSYATRVASGGCRRLGPQLLLYRPADGSRSRAPEACPAVERMASTEQARRVRAGHISRRGRDAAGL
jgi:hypothetical protein